MTIVPLLSVAANQKLDGPKVEANIKRVFRNPHNKTEGYFHSINIMLADAIHQGIGIKGLRLILGIKYLQRGTEEVFVGEVHAIYREITGDPSWSYEACRNMCNTMSKDGWLDKHKIDGYVAYTLSPKTKRIFNL